MSILGAIKGAVTGFIAGGPGGALVGAAAGAFGGGSQPKPAAQLPPPSYGAGGGYGIQTPFGGFTVGGGVAITKGVSGQVNYTPGSGSDGCPRGTHLNKHALPASRSHGAVPARTICVRNRHLNALNGRAAMRALRRLKRASKATRKIHAVFHRRAPAPKRVGGRK